MPAKVIDVDLAFGPRSLTGLHGYDSACVLLRWNALPIGRLALPVCDGRIDESALWRDACTFLKERFARSVLDDWLPGTAVDRSTLPSVTVAVCTRDRPADIETCLRSICSARSRTVDILVVDNAPSDDRTRTVVQGFPVRYSVEPRPGLNWARHHAAEKAIGELVIYTDDDVVVEPDWVDQIRTAFDSPDVACVTGLVMPLELETEAQNVFEFTVGGFSRGFLPKRYTASTIAPVAAANVGAGANMAFRRDLVLEMGLFARELDVGTPARAAGDTYAFFRVLDAGYTISYTPRALVWHRHRRDMQNLISTLRGYNVGTYVFLLRCLLEHRDPAAIHAGWWWFRYHLLRNLWRGLRGNSKAQPLGLTFSELRGLLDVPRAYTQSIRREQEAAR